jgi:hypothetical protein
VASPNGLSNTCGGSPAATAASSSVSLSGGTVAANSSCTLSISVTGTAAGVKNNTTGTLSSAESGVGAISNTATMTVLAPPTIAKAFGAATLLDNATTSLTFTLANPNSTASLTGVGFTDTLPSGLTVATPNGQSGSCGGGTITATAGSNTVSLSGASLAASGSCVFSVNVSRTGTGNQLNVTGNVTSGNGGSGNTASAAVIAVQRTFTGPTATGGVGTATITTANGGNACGFTHAQWLPLSSAPPTPLPLGFPQGLFDFTVGNCQPGFSMVLTLTFDSALPPGTSYWKYGPTSDNASWHWYIMPGTVNGNVVTLNFTDGALGDDDLSASNGIIQDQGGPAFALQATTVPTLQRWVLALLILLFVAMAAAVMRQGRRAR